MQINELESVAEFPTEMEAFRAVLVRVDDYNAARVKMSAEMADSSNLAKTLVIKADDALTLTLTLTLSLTLILALTLTLILTLALALALALALTP